MSDKCFCCGKPLKATARQLVDTQDGQIVFVDEQRFPVGSLRLYKPAFEVRWRFEYESSGEGTKKIRVSSSPSEAHRFAKAVTINGDAFPAVANVALEKRPNRYRPWMSDQHFYSPVEIIDGQVQ